VAAVLLSHRSNPHEEGYADLVAEIEHEMTKRKTVPGNSGAAGTPARYPSVSPRRRMLSALHELSQSISSDTALKRANSWCSREHGICSRVTEAKPRVAEFGRSSGGRYRGVTRQQRV
jgi:hypothetical protein